MGTASRCRNQYTRLRVRLKNDFPCYTNRGWQLSGMFAMFVFADMCGFLLRFRLLMMDESLDGH